MVRVLDIVLSFLGLLIFSPVFIVVACITKLTSRGPVFYTQKRVGKNGAEFYMIKFRTMVAGADKFGGLLTVTNHDNRITPFGRFLRKYKLDELPQFLNVLAGNMSIVGPRPEVKKYVDLYSTEQRAVLCVLPGITDFASLKYKDEAEVLSAQKDPETYYIQTIMPEKIRLNQLYISNPTVSNYFRIIILTIRRLLFR